MIDPGLVAARSIHLAATLLLEGSICFRFFVADPLRSGDARRHASRDWIAPGAYVVAVLSGVAWLAVLSANLAGTAIADAFADGTVWKLLTETQFGLAWQARAAGLLLLGLGMAIVDRAPPSRVFGAALALLSMGLSGAIAWSGHGAATPGPGGTLHVAADFLHLAAAGLWVGGLLPFAILLLRSKAHEAERVSRRFSLYATLSVLILLASGIANSWFILGSIDALTGTFYGHLLLAKILLFLLMLAFAAVNRFVLMPQLASAAKAPNATHRLVIHSGCELPLGVVVVVIVAVLGTLSPGM